MTRRNAYLSLAVIGVIALVAGVGRLVQAYEAQDPVPDLVPIPILVAAAVFGLVVTGLTLRAVANLFLDAHPNLSRMRLTLAIAGTSTAIILAYAAGAARWGI